MTDCKNCGHDCYNHLGVRKADETQGKAQGVRCFVLKGVGVCGCDHYVPDSKTVKGAR